jgi:KDO2-lipid IV(A) lauroyltransferase
VRRRSDYPAYLAMRGLVAAVSPWPRPVALAAGAALGRAAREIFGLRRAVADENLASAFPVLPPVARADLARRMYKHFGRVAVDSLRVTAGGNAAVVPFVRAVEGESLLRSLVARGRGVIMLAGHHGNWEAAAAWAAAIGLPVAAVVKPPSNPWVADYVERQRRRMGVETIPMPEARAEVPKALAAGKIVGLVADQGAMRSSTWVPFFGRPTQTPEGPGFFAARTGAPVAFGGFVAEADGCYRGFVELIEDAPRGEARELILRIATLYRQRLEAVVRLAPEQYLWTHRLWARRPPETPAER